jgi:hypothetical protein
MLAELKRQNMHIFVEAARENLQNLWDELYFSEEQMAEFTPAFTGIFSVEPRINCKIYSPMHLLLRMNTRLSAWKALSPPAKLLYLWSRNTWN